MALPAGTRMGPYEVVAEVGVGGMGEVYKARDTRLDRTVAIKVLPADLGCDPERRARFEREAKTVAALSHPHICPLFDVGECAPTGQGHATLYLVMEYLQGQTLAERLEKGPMPLEQALAVAAEIAHALSAAHRQGIVHRDLKPANVMLTKVGAKLLDFGLAKLTAHGEEPAAMMMSAAPTQAATLLTGAGTIVGTLQYMAPEQLQGKPPDARTDLWALGAILYEMLTGRRAFEASSAVSLMSAIMEREPVPIPSLQPLTPPALDRIVRRCLAKAPDDRPDTAHDVAEELSSLRESRRASEGSVQRLPRSKTRWVAAVAGIAAVALACALGYRLGRTALPPSHVTRLSVPLSPGGPVVAPLPPRAGASVAISPDGLHVVYVSERHGATVLVHRALDRRDETVLKGTEGAFSPFFSPDGGWVAYFTETQLRKVALEGGASIDVCPTPPVSRGGSWAEDGNIYFTPDFTSGIQRVPARGGRAVNVSTLDPATKEGNHLFPEVVPAGKHLLFTAWTGGAFEAAGIWTLSLGSATRSLLVDGASQPRYVPPGYLVFARAGRLFAARFDARTSTLSGPSTAVVDDVWNEPATGTVHYAVSHTGTLVYVPSPGSAPPTRLAWVDRRGRVEFLPSAAGYYDQPKISPDGRRLAVVQLNDIWLYDFSARTMTRATYRGVNQAPVWTPDGRHVAFSSSQDVSRPTLYWLAPGRMEGPEILSRDGEVQFPASWSPDGALAYSEIKMANPEAGFDVWLLTGGPPWRRQRLIGTPFSDEQPMFSPDGRALAWVSTETGRPQVYLRAYPTGERILVSSEGGTEPVWSRAGTELFYRHGQEFLSVAVRTKGIVTVGRPSVLFRGDFLVGSITPGVPGYDVAPDGQRFLVVVRATEAARPARIDVVTNWLEELAAKLPTGREQ